jgi:hypothetical protein
MAKVALITGVTGQDGAYLSELLLEKGYIVHGLKRRSSMFNTARIDHLYKDKHEKNVNFFLHHGDLTDSTNLIRLVSEIKPDEIYNLAAQSHVKVSFETPEYTANADAIGTLSVGADQAAVGDPQMREAQLLRLRDVLHLVELGPGESEFHAAHSLPMRRRWHILSAALRATAPRTATSSADAASLGSRPR